MKNILKYWIDGWSVILKALYFYIVCQIIAGLFMCFVPLLFWIGLSFQSEVSKTIVMLIALVLSLLVLPFPFLLAANITNVFTDKKQYPQPSPENAKKGEILMEELRRKRKKP
jgi:hypothetical protein